MKKLIALFALVAMVAVSSVAYAQTDDALLNASVNSSTTIQACGVGNTDITLAAIDVDDYTDNSATPCEVIAYSNNQDGFTVALNGSDDGLLDATPGTTEWTKLVSTIDVFDVATPNTEAWGFRVANGSDSEYNDNPAADTDNNSRAFNDATPYWHTVNYATAGGGSPNGAETIVASDQAVAAASSFNLVIGAVSSPSTEAHSYQDTLTLTLTEL